MTFELCRPPLIPRIQLGAMLARYERDAAA